MRVDLFVRMSYQRISCLQSYFPFLSLSPFSIVHRSRQYTVAVKMYAYVRRRGRHHRHRRHRCLDTYTFLWIIRWKNTITEIKVRRWHNKWSRFISGNEEKSKRKNHCSSYSPIWFSSLLFCYFFWLVHAFYASFYCTVYIYYICTTTTKERATTNTPSRW